MYSPLSQAVKEYEETENKIRRLDKVVSMIAHVHVHVYRCMCMYNVQCTSTMYMSVYCSMYSHC